MVILRNTKLMIIPVFLFLLLFSVDAQAQKILRFACENQQPKTEREFKIWLKEDVGYIITNAENESFFKLQTNEDRNKFIEKFWLRRDPNPDTAENEFRDEYCKRANNTSQFDSGILGWRTDRGKIYILYGEPDSIEKGRAFFEENDNVLYERWFYKNFPENNDGVEFYFVDPTEGNEFRLLKSR